MRKSYVTQYTEYVSEQLDKFNAKLKNRGITASPNATLGELIDSLDALQEQIKTPKYERDPNFPDIDTMFDEDPLRAVNGGSYLGCSYFIMHVDANKKVGVYFMSNYGHKADKLVMHNGEDYGGGAEATTFDVPDSAIFYDTDGAAFCLLKVYRETPLVITNNMYYTKGIREWIEDQFIGFNLNTTGNAPSGYNPPAVSIRYLRYVGSNVTADNASTAKWVLGSNSYETGTMLIKYLRVDGLNCFNSYNFMPLLEKLDVRGSYAGTSNLTIGGTDTSQYGYNALFWLPEVLLPPTINYFTAVVYGAKKLIIPDSYTTVQMYFYNNANGTTDRQHYLESVHLGSGLTTWIQGSSGQKYFYSLKYITTSPNIYANNESAVTLDLGFAHLLTKQSVLNLFNGVADRTGKTANIIKLSANVKAFLTDEEKAILTNKNWTLS